MSSIKVKSPDGRVETHTWANAQDLVRNAKWTFVKSEEEVIAEVRSEAHQNSNTNGNTRAAVETPPLDAEEIEEQMEAARQQAESAPDTIDDMTKDELLEYATEQGIAVDKRMGRENLLKVIREHTDEEEDD